jgi:hypothetical protein
MNKLSISSVINKNAIISDTPWLMAVEAKVVDPETLIHVETLRFVKNTENVTLGGEEFVAGNFDLGIDESEGVLPTISLTVVDITQTLQKLMQEYKGGSKSEVIVYFFSAPTTDLPTPDTQYHFDVISSSADSESYSVTWVLGAENPLTLQVPSRTQTVNRCQWRYKGEQCGYSGGLASCDLSLEGANGCGAHENKERFGGYPGISD